MLFLLLLFAAEGGSDFAAPIPLNQAEWLSSDNYPSRARALEKAGLTQADIFVDSTGRPQACYVVVSSGSTDLDGQSCAAAMQRGRFTPAHDEQGVAMNGVFRFRTSWEMEGRRAKPAPADVTLSVARLPSSIASAWVGLRYLVDEQGHILRCGIEKSSGFASLDQAACKAMPGRYSFAPARDKDGRASRVIRTQIVGFEVPATRS